MDAITDMGGVAREGFNAIKAVACLAMRWLETQQDGSYDGRAHLGIILGLIRDQAVNCNSIIFDIAGRPSNKAAGRKARL